MTRVLSQRNVGSQVLRPEQEVLYRFPILSLFPLHISENRYRSKFLSALTHSVPVFYTTRESSSTFYCDHYLSVSEFSLHAQPAIGPRAATYNINVVNKACHTHLTIYFLQSFISAKVALNSGIIEGDPRRVRQGSDSRRHLHAPLRYKCRFWRAYRPESSSRSSY